MGRIACLTLTSAVGLLFLVGESESASNSVENCLEIKESQGTEAFLKCIAGGTGASTLPPEKESPWCQANVKDDVDWVFVDPGAKANYDRHISMGYSPYEAVYAAQGHNSEVQCLFEVCRTWVISYLSGRGVPTAVQTITDKNLTVADCACISILPVGVGYNVTSACPMTVRVAVSFQDALGSNQSFTTPSFLLGGSQTQYIAAPNLPLSSISASIIESTKNRIVCRYH